MLSTLSHRILVNLYVKWFVNCSRLKQSSTLTGVSKVGMLPSTLHSVTKCPFSFRMSLTPSFKYRRNEDDSM